MLMMTSVLCLFDFSPPCLFHAHPLSSCQPCSRPQLHCFQKTSCFDGAAAFISFITFFSFLSESVSVFEADRLLCVLSLSDWWSVWRQHWRNSWVEAALMFNSFVFVLNHRNPRRPPLVDLVFVVESRYSPTGTQQKVETTAGWAGVFT